MNAPFLQHKALQKIKNSHPIRHFLTITEHKLLVMRGCFAVGLYWQGLLHDLSKYAPSEFVVGAIYYQGNRSPNNAEREDIGYSSAWLHHKGRNRHHYEYWIDYNSRADKAEDITVPVKMPLKYVVEMLMDRIAASKIYNKGNYTDDLPFRYFERSMDRIPMHRETKNFLYGLLRMLSVYGEEKTFHYVRHRLLKQKDY
ncbi:MAG: DUF5662 family protein [Lachnospiraceae bacterium]|nr:DUF5662 family protein [Lachnospiraceae bacterium]